jgi:hypothetical protein
LAIDLAAEKWVRFAKTASAVLLQSGGGAPASRSRATLIAVDGKQTLQPFWRGGGEVDGCAHWSRTFRIPIKSAALRAPEIHPFRG